MQNKKPPQALIQLIKAIIQCQSQTDVWKSKLFYIPINDLYAALTQQQSNDDNNEPSSKSQQQQQQHQNQSLKQSQTISLTQILTFIQQTNQMDLNQSQQRVIQKYFNFITKSTYPIEQFIKKLKPINNKLILSIQRENINSKQYLNNLFKSVLEGYQKINPLRKYCADQFTQIVKYFLKQQTLNKNNNIKINNNNNIINTSNNSINPILKVVSKQQVKQVMFEADIYSRVNLMYVKQYIFGDSQKDVIQWSVLLGQKDLCVSKGYNVEDEKEQQQEEQELDQQLQVVKNIDKDDRHFEHLLLGQQLKRRRGDFERIQQLSQQHIVTEKVIITMDNYNKKQQQQQQLQTQLQLQKEGQQLQQYQQQLQLQQPQQLQKQLQKQKQTNTHTTPSSQISQIEQLLNQTKQRYLRNKLLLENQTKNIKLKQQQTRNNIINNNSSNNSNINDNNDSIKNSNGNKNNKYSYMSRASQIYEQQAKAHQNQQSKQVKQVNPIFTQPPTLTQPSTPIKQHNNMFSHKIQIHQRTPSQPIKLQTPSPQNMHLLLREEEEQMNYFNNTNNKNYQLQQSHVKPFVTREMMKKQIQSTLSDIGSIITINNNNAKASPIINYTSNNNSNQPTQRRQVGKIKKRSLSKDHIIEDNQNIQNNNNKDNNIKNSNNNNQYQQYQAILKQVQRQSSPSQSTQYKNILINNQNYNNDKLFINKNSNGQQDTKRKRLTLDISNSQNNKSPSSLGLFNRYTPINALLQATTQQKLKQPQPQQFQLKQQPKHEYTKRSSSINNSNTQKPLSHSRYEQIMKQIQTNSLARSRVSSKKRQEIVQKATSQAKLRIQQIENRALSRLGRKIDTYDQRSNSSNKKINNYLNMNNNNINNNIKEPIITDSIKQFDDLPKYRRTQDNMIKTATKSNKSSSPKSNYLLINDLMNSRPTTNTSTGLKLTSTTMSGNNWRQRSKY